MPSARGCRASFSILLMRWFLIYVMPLTVGAGLALDYAVPERAERSVVALCGVVVTAFPLVLMDRWYDTLQPYDPKHFDPACSATRTSS